MVFVCFLVVFLSESSTNLTESRALERYMIFPEKSLQNQTVELSMGAPQPRGLLGDVGKTTLNRKNLFPHNFSGRPYASDVFPLVGLATGSLHDGNPS